MSIPYLIGDLPGFTPEIGRLVGMMEYARRTTLSAVEFAYQLGTLAGRGFNEVESRHWAPALQLGAAGRRQVRGYELGHYLEHLAEVCRDTLAEFSIRDDDWLDEQTPSWDGLPANNYFKWFHVFGNEINHRGQIRWLRARLLML